MARFVHFNERRAKATGLHAAALAPDDAEIIVVIKNADGEFVVPDVSDCEPETSVLLFPGPGAVTFSALARAAKEEPLLETSSETSRKAIPSHKPTTLLFIDGTWQQANLLAELPFFRRFRTLTLAGQHHTLFWRHHRFGDSYLSTIECTYWACREWWEAYLGEYGTVEWEGWNRTSPDQHRWLKDSTRNRDSTYLQVMKPDKSSMTDSPERLAPYEGSKPDMVSDESLNQESRDFDAGAPTSGLLDNDLHFPAISSDSDGFEELVQEISLVAVETDTWATPSSPPPSRPSALSRLRPLDDLLFYFRHQYLVVRERYLTMMTGEDSASVHRMAILRCAHSIIPGLEKPGGVASQVKKPRKKRVRK
ncbi:DTW domain-containing protein 1 [Gonapodya sp. JEL0774]|nr:DTW domain-containing protein 1 [Gonapodya sp. JEL0774]